MSTDDKVKNLENTFYDFLTSEMERHKALTGCDDKSAVKFVLGIIFESILKLWIKAYGHKFMAEYFYRYGDKMVDKSNKDK